MTKRPKIAVLIAESIAESAHIECSLGVILAVILETEAQTGLAMYLSLTSSNNQITVLSAAAKAKLTVSEDELFRAVLMVVRSAIKERHKLAHWCWALSTELPDALLLIDPSDQAPLLANMLGLHDPLVEIDRSKFFVLKADDAQEIATKIKTAKKLLNQLLGAFWEHNRSKRAELCQKLSNEPQIQEALVRLRKGQKSDPEAP